MTVHRIATVSRLYVITFTYFSVILSVLLGCSGRQNNKTPLPEPWTPVFSQLMSEDLDLLVRVNLTQLRDHGWVQIGKRGWKMAGLSDSVLHTIEGCLQTAEEMLLGVRLSDRGLDGDLVLVLTGLADTTDSSKQTHKSAFPKGNVGSEHDDSRQVPCDAKGWKHTGAFGRANGYVVFEPEVTSTKRSAAALMMFFRNELLVATPGQVDTVLRLLANGPDADPMTARGKGDSNKLLVMQSRVSEARISEIWANRWPWISGLLRKQLGFMIQFEAEQLMKLTVSVQFENKIAASDAGLFLKQIRQRLIQSDNSLVRNVAKSSHAQIKGTELEVWMTIEEGER